MGNQILLQNDGNHVSGIIDVNLQVKQDRIWEISGWVDKHSESMRENE